MIESGNRVVDARVDYPMLVGRVIGHELQTGRVLVSWCYFRGTTRVYPETLRKVGERPIGTNVDTHA